MPTDIELIEFMSKKYPDYNKGQLYRDKHAIRANNDFVANMSIHSYSHYVADIWHKIEIIERSSLKLLSDPSGFTKINAHKVVLDAQKLKMDLMTQNMDISVEKLGKLLSKLTEENKKLKEERILKSKS